LHLSTANAKKRFLRAAEARHRRRFPRPFRRGRL